MFMLYLFLMIRRLTVLYDFLRHVPAGEQATRVPAAGDRALAFLGPLFSRLEPLPAPALPMRDLWWMHLGRDRLPHQCAFQAIAGYVHTLVLIGFAGTIFGSIGAFNEMFQGIAQGRAAAEVFAASWNKGLSTALYTSLGAAAIGGVVLTLIGSRFLLTRARRLETMAGLRIADILAPGDA